MLHDSLLCFLTKYDDYPNSCLFDRLNGLIHRLRHSNMMGSNCNDWVLESKKRRLRNVVDILEPGDIVRMPSIVFTHYGIAVGDGCMIHLVPEPEQNRFLGRGLYEQVDIVEYCLEKNKSCQKDNSRDNRDGWVPYASSEVVARANSKLRNASEVYSMVFNNCEKFALWCRYVYFFSIKMSELFSEIEKKQNEK